MRPQAVQHRRSDVLEYLLHRGDVDIDREYGMGWTVLSLAAATKNVHVNVVKMLVGCCFCDRCCRCSRLHA